MKLYSVGNSKSGVNTANTVMWLLKTGANKTCYLRTLGIYIASAPTTAPLFAIASPTALGTSTTTTAGQANRLGDSAAVTTLDSAWSSAPTFNTSGPFLYLFGLATTAGNGIIYTFNPSEELEIPVSSGLVIANTLAAGATVGTMVCTASFLE
jgi:hypothetical protein